MKNKFNLLFTLLFSAMALYSYGQKSLNNNQKEMKTKRILFVLTSVDEVKATGHKTGVWIEEFAAPYYLMLNHGLEITLATPKGGKAPIDPKSLLPDFSTADVQKFTADKEAINRLNHTLKLADLNINDYDAVYYPGGHGPMWDLPENKLSINIIETFYAKGKPVALVCHAPAALQNVKAPNGEPLVKGKKISAFTNTEEVAGKSTAETPYSLEDMLKEKGADYVRTEDWKPFAIADGNLITGQNPASAELVGKKILEALGFN
ncbi:type 1 glutamine amidotransferase domain-containing protein [Pedobacter punctiformis]|uniref:Type 1 glutamine amidotransferase domain-containing protein n=1 Tax=Pedobacter punctiformis TaxID=3004097 RepID=A0ABT4LAX0_9SPHI|nr:type 1 glutamine amidotransferase domain-containing protein [Pedobacter sp. HCMS5-2]MCZ4245071.1 type 1 glutamine amidotransferase domain-containing protein [Pedobacter sp. HCMS5-2]